MGDSLLTSTNDLLGLGAGIIGLGTGTLRYLAVLGGAPKNAVERKTAIGFFGGLAGASVAIVVAVSLGGYP